MQPRIAIWKFTAASRLLGMFGVMLVLFCASAEAADGPQYPRMPLDVPTVGVAENVFDDVVLGQSVSSAAVPTDLVSPPAPASSLSTDFSGTRAALEQLPVRIGYDQGFLIASQRSLDLKAEDYQYSLLINGYGQLRETVFESRNTNPELNQLQLKRARLIFSGHALNPDFRYFVQLDGQSNSGDAVRLLDYFLTYDFGHRDLSLEKGTFGFKTGLYKMPFSLARQLSGQQLQFADRSMASMYFDVNRSLGAGLYGRTNGLSIPLHWEVSLFNGLVTGGAETGSSGTLDNNNAFSARVYLFPVGDWETGELADLTWHDSVATRVGAGAAFTTIDRSGSTEFNALRVVDSGLQLSSLLPGSVDQYSVALYSLDAGMKYLGASLTCEVYFRNVSGFRGAALPDLFDHGLWLQAGKFMIPEKLEILSRWSRVEGNSGTLGGGVQSSEEIAGGVIYYFQQQHAKLTVDATYVNGAPINSSSLDISLGDVGWLYRSQLQFSF